MKAWIYKDPKQVAKLGDEGASWYVGWRSPDGKRHCQSCGPGSLGKMAAKKKCDKLHIELSSGTYQSNQKVTWESFRKEFDRKVMDGMDGPNRESTGLALKHFERIISPQRMTGITSLTIATYVAKRREEYVARSREKRGGKPATKVSPATVNRELRSLRAALRKAVKWKHLAEMPDFEFLKCPGKIPTYCTPEHFAQLYAACDKAKWPKDQPYPAGDWWRGLLVMAFMTGWRIASLLALRREHVDLDGGTALSLTKDNKGKRDQKIPLHPIVVEHLRKLPGFSPLMFPWNHRRATIFAHFKALQKLAGVKADTPKGHYGFHDFRRAFATMNAESMTADALQAFMQHKDYTTTQRYISIGRQLKPAAHALYVPDVGLRIAQPG